MKNKMERFMTKLRKFKQKISIKYLIFIFLISIGCFYQVVQVTLVFLEFETKIDVSIDKTEIEIPMISFCSSASKVFRDGKKQTFGLTPAQVYNQTLNFGEIVIYMDYYLMDDENGYFNTHFHAIWNFTKHEEDVQSQKFNSTVDIQIEKSISHLRVCYNFKHPQNKVIRPRFSKKIYQFILYHQNRTSFNIVLSSKNHSPNNNIDNEFEVSGDNFFFQIFKNY